MIDTINIGISANDGMGDPLRTAFQKTNTNFLNITADGGDEITVLNPTTSTDTTLNDALQDVFDAGGGGGAVSSVNGDTGAVVVDLESVLTEGNRPIKDLTALPDYTFILGDETKYILDIDTGDKTIPDAVFTIGDELIICNDGSGATNILTEGSDVFRVGGSSVTTISLEVGYLAIIKMVGSNAWNVNLIPYSVSSGGVSDGDKGDITVSSAGTVWTIDNGAVSLAKTSGVQGTLVSGTNIKTINGTSVLGSGDISIGGVGATQNARATRLELTSDINLPISATGSVSVIDFDNTIFNVDPTVFTNNGAGTITCTLAGNYLVTTSVVIESPLASAITKSELGIRKNGTNVICATTDDNPIALGNNIRSLTTSTIINLAANDTLQAVINLFGASATGRALRLPALFGTTATQVSNISIERLEVSEFDVDSTIIDGSANAVSGNAVFDALALKADKSQSAYTVRVNNTNATANTTEITFRQSGQLAYTDTPTFVAGTAPSGTPNLTYNWQRLGNMVTAIFTFDYSVSGATVTQIIFPIPSDMPAPVVPTGFTGANVILYTGDALLTNTLTNSTASVSDQFSALRRNAGDTAFEFIMSGASASYRSFRATIVYPVA